MSKSIIRIAAILLSLVLLPSCSAWLGNDGGDTVTTDPAESSVPTPSLSISDVPSPQMSRIYGVVNKLKNEENGTRLYETAELPYFKVYEGAGWNNYTVCRVGDQIELKAKGWYDFHGNEDNSDPDHIPARFEVIHRLTDYCVSVKWAQQGIFSSSHIYNPNDPPTVIMRLEATVPGFTVVTFAVRDHAHEAEVLLHYPIIVIE